MVCNYGCKQEALYQFKNGRWCCCKSHVSCPAVKEKNHVSNINRDYKTNYKMKEAWKKRKKKPEYIKQQKERGILQSKAMKKLWQDGIYDGEEYRRKLSDGIKKVWADPDSIYNSLEWRKSQSKRTKRLFKDPIFLKKYQDGQGSSPNSCEKFICNLLKEIVLDKYRFVGDHSLWIGGKNPDFINENENKIIEFFGDYWHSEEVTGVSHTVEEEERINHFKEYGYQVLVIWEHELKNKEILKKRIGDFDNE